MRTNLLGEPLGLTYRQLKHRQMLKISFWSILLAIGILTLMYLDGQALQANIIH